MSIHSKDCLFSEEIPFLQGQKPIEQPCAAAHTCNASTWEVEPRSGLQGEPGLHVSTGKVMPT